MSDTDPNEDKVHVTMTKDAARRYADVLLNRAVDARPHERDWLLWGVGMIAQGFRHEADGPDTSNNGGQVPF